MLLNIFYTTIISSVSIFWTLILVPFLILGYTFYYIDEKSIIIIISKNIKYSIIRNEDEDPSGFFIGSDYIGFISNATKNNDNVYLYCLCTSFRLKELKKKEEIKESDVYIELLVRMGNSYYYHYNLRELNCTEFVAKGKQIEIIKNITENFYVNQKNVSIISGPPGSGKSILGILLTKAFKGTLCKSYSPTIAGDKFERVYNHANPNIKCPLIVLIDEFDTIIDLFHNNIVQLNSKFPTEVYNKATWNSLFDDFSIKMYRYTIIILTTNLTIKQLETRDSSYIRPGRIDNYYEL